MGADSLMVLWFITNMIVIVVGGILGFIYNAGLKSIVFFQFIVFMIITTFYLYFYGLSCGI